MDQICARGTCSSNELVAAALCLPGIEGWSGMVESHSSSCHLNWSGLPAVMSLRALGMTLNSWAPLTWRDDSFAFFTEAGALFTKELTCITLPLLGEVVKVAWYPCTRPWATFHKKIILYLSLLLS